MSNGQEHSESDDALRDAGARIVLRAPEDTGALDRDRERGLRALRRFALSVRSTIVIRRAAWTAAGVLAAAAGLMGMDWVVRWSAGPRTAALGALVAGAIWAFARWIAPALRLRLDAAQAALRLEATAWGHAAHLRERLASAVELYAHSGAALPSAALRDVWGAAARLRLREVLNLRPALHALGALAALLLIGAAWSAAQPAAARTGWARLMWPWGEAAWPRRTMVVDATAPGAHSLAAALQLRAVLARTPGAPEDARATVHVRVVLLANETGKGMDTPGAERELPMVYQGRDEDAGLSAAARGPLFERLIDPAALAELVPHEGAVDAFALEYWVEAGDDRTAAVRIPLVTPPRVVAARVRVDPPKYLEGAPGFSRRVQELVNPAAVGRGETASRTALPKTPGIEATAPHSPAFVGVIAGSRVSVTVEFNKPVVVSDEHLISVAPAGSAESRSAPAAAGAAASGTTPEVQTKIETTPTIWKAEATAGGDLVIAPRFADRFGIGPVTEPAYRIAVTPDAPPTSAVVSPERDEDVLADAVVSVTCEARDDLGVVGVRALARPARRNATSAGAAPEGDPGGPVVVAERDSEGARVGARLLSAAGAVRIADFGVVPGDEVWITAAAVDAYADERGPRAPTVSPVRRLRVISRAQLVDRMFAELAGVRRGALEAAARQGALSESMAKSTAEQSAAGEKTGAALQRQREEAARAQRELGQRIDALSAALKKVEASTGSAIGQGQSKPGDESAEVARLVRAALQDAAAAKGASDTAADSLAQRGGASSSEAGADQAAADAAQSSNAHAAQAAQKEARAKLESLAQTLDRGEGAFAQLRKLERLLNDQRALREKTAAQARAAAGKETSDLSPAERAEGERLTQEQGALAQRAADALRAMKAEAERTKQSDAAGAQSMSAAAQEGEKAGVTSQMEEAARELGRNQQQRAQERQKNAEEALAKVTKALKEAQQQREAILRRELDELVAALRALVTRQEAEVAALDDAGESPARLAGRAAAVIALRTATLSAGVQAQGAGPEGAGALEPLASAAGRQASAAAALRAVPADVRIALQAERDAAENLKAALEAARSAQAQAQTEEKKAQAAAAKAAYEAVLARQTAARERAEAILRMPADRRQRAAAGALAPEQDAVGTALDDIAKAQTAIAKSAAFTLAHELMTSASAAAAEGLRKAPVTGAVTLRQTRVVETLTALIAALDDAEKEGDGFREGAQDEGAQQGGGKGKQQEDEGLPPIAQLRALRGMQERALAATKAAAAAGIEAKGDSGRGLVAEAGDVQKRLAEATRQLVELMKQKSDGAKGGGQ